ncbi:MAG: lamin tail domain-containing protein [Persicimonas sp.]
MSSTHKTGPTSKATIWLGLLWTLLATAACVPTPEWSCRRTSDCASGEFCRAGQCRPAIGDPDKTSPNTDAAWSDSQDAGPLEPSRCEEGDPPEAGDLVLNEVLVNVPTGPDGDANEDGIRDPYDDEFVEVVNGADHTIDLTGVAIANGSTPKFTFGATCLEPQQAAVVFGGGLAPARDDAIVRVSSSRFAFSNNGGTVAIFDEAGQVLSALNYDAGPAEALTLAPQLDGEHFVPHSTLSEEFLLSPGTCADGRAFSAGCGQDD